MAARRGAWKRGAGTIVIRWQDDEKYRNSRQAHGWTEEYCRYLDYLTTIDISYITPWHQRDQYECTITLVCNDEDRQAGPMKARKDFKPTTKILASLRQEQGRQFFQSKERENETKTIRWCIASRIRMDESKLEYLFLATFFLFNILTKLVPSRTSRLSMAWTPRHPMARSPMARSPTARSQVVERVNAADYLQKRCGRHFARFSRIRRFLFKGVSLTGNSDSLVSDGEGEDRTPRRTHIFLSLVSVPHLMALFTRTCVRVAQDKIGMSCIPARLLESSSHLTACFTERSSTCLTHSHHFVPRHHRRHWFTADTNQENPLRHSASRCSLAIWLNHLLTQKLLTSHADFVRHNLMPMPPTTTRAARELNFAVTCMVFRIAKSGSQCLREVHVSLRRVVLTECDSGLVHSKQDRDILGGWAVTGIREWPRCASPTSRRQWSACITILSQRTRSGTREPSTLRRIHGKEGSSHRGTYALYQIVGTARVRRSYSRMITYSTMRFCQPQRTSAERAETRALKPSRVRSELQEGFLLVACWTGASKTLYWLGSYFVLLRIDHSTSFGILDAEDIAVRFYLQLLQALSEIPAIRARPRQRQVKSYGWWIPRPHWRSMKTLIGWQCGSLQKLFHWMNKSSGRDWFTISCDTLPPSFLSFTKVRAIVPTV